MNKFINRSQSWLERGWRVEFLKSEKIQNHGDAGQKVTGSAKAKFLK